MNAETVCAWCGKRMSAIADESATAHRSHGICIDCAGDLLGMPVEAVEGMTAEQADRLPYGRIVLDRGNRVREYNRLESALSHRRAADVIGRDFFTEVAPCTNVQALAGWVAEARVLGRDARTETDFVFAFPFGQEFVHIALVFNADSRQVVLLVRQIAREAAESA